MTEREKAKRNLELAGLFDKDSAYNGMLGNAVMKLVNCHFDEGHSGMSHEYTLHLFNKVVRGHALTAKYWDEQKDYLDKFAMENMGEPWQEDSIQKLIGSRPVEETNEQP